MCWVANRNNIKFGNSTLGGGIYVGDFKDGKRTGFGKMIYKDGSYYEGNWDEGSYHGYGK